MHVQLFMTAFIDQCLHYEPGKATPAEFFKGKDAVDFMPVRVKSAPCDGDKRPVDKGAENAVFFGVGLLLVIVVPDLFDEREFSGGEFAGQGGCGCGKRNPLYDWDMKCNSPNGGSKGNVYGQITIHYNE